MDDVIAAKILRQNPLIKSFIFLDRSPMRAIENLKYAPSLEEFIFEWSPEMRGMDDFPWQQLKKITFTTDDYPDNLKNRHSLIVPHGWHVVNEHQEFYRTRLMCYITVLRSI